MNEKKVIVIAIISTVILLFGGIFFLTKTANAPQIAASENSKAYLADPTNFDWGTIAIHKGNVTKVFVIKNAGTDVLKLFNIKTSCHCTNAYVTINGNNSPSFGMDTLSAWTGEVPAGKEAKLTVVFDPAFHGPEAVGPINRFVSVETNDKSNPKLTFTLTGNVVK